MKRNLECTNFVITLLFNMAINIGWTIPAWILLAMHFLFGWSILWFWLALGLWILDILLWMDIMGWAARCGSEPDKPKENKNPYSVGAKKPDSINTNTSDNK